MYKNYFKYWLDFFIAFTFLLLFMPVFIIITILLFVKIGNPFFYQNRPGLKGKIFRIIKFKTMTDETDKNGVLLDDNIRLTTLGKIIRKTSLDELPQLLNVLKGEMSIIGPRPLLPEYLELYSVEQSMRHNVKPGITGWAQVNGRNAISWEDKFKLDVWYVNNISFFLDVKVVFLTIKKVLISEGINSDGEATTTKFKGSK